MANPAITHIRSDTDSSNTATIVSTSISPTGDALLCVAVGFAGGNNVGLEQAQKIRVDYALLLNNDTEVAPDFLKLFHLTVNDKT